MRNSEKHKKRSLTTRIVVVSIGIFFLISCVNTAISITSVKKRTGDAMLESYTDLVKQAAHRAEEVIVESNNNTDEIQKFIEEELKENKYMAYSVVIDRDANAIAHTDTTKVGKSYTYDEYTVDAIKNGKVKNGSYYAKDLGCWTYDIMVPINVNGQLYGVFDIGIYENKISDIINSLMIRQIMSLVVGVILFAVIMNVIGKKLFSPLRDLADHCNVLSRGDFSKYIATEKFARNIEIDTIATALDNMQKDFVSVIKDIDESAENISSAVEELAENTRQTAQTADEISNAVGEIAEGATKQARDSEVGLRSIEELSTIVNDNKTHIEKLNEATVKVGKFKDEGILALKELVEANKHNNEEMDKVNEIIVNTRESAEKIEVSSQMIMSISEQTNLLALNAAIEAARAGETGRGFAVVADEIRKLAEQSNEFTNEITKVIRELADKTTIGVTSMEEVKKSSEIQNESVVLTTDKFEGIALAIEDVDKIIGVVSECSDKISNKNDDFVQIVNNLSVVSEENAASTEEVAASVQEQEASVSVISSACGELEKLAVNMKDEIEKFNY